MCVDGIEKKEMEVDVGFVLPSDIIDYVLTHGSGSATQSSFYSNGRSAVFEYWMNELQTHVDRLELKPEEFATTLPLMWHEDAVPHWHGSTGTFWSWSTPLAFGGAWSSRHCFVGLTTSSITQATRRAILNILQWDLKVLRAGVRATCDHLGHPFQSGHRAKLSGQPLAMKAAFAYWKGDAEARFTAHDLQLYIFRQEVVIFRHLQLVFEKPWVDFSCHFLFLHCFPEVRNWHGTTDVLSFAIAVGQTAGFHILILVISVRLQSGERQGLSQSQMPHPGRWCLGITKSDAFGMDTCMDLFVFFPCPLMRLVGRCVVCLWALACVRCFLVALAT